MKKKMFIMYFLFIFSTLFCYDSFEHCLLGEKIALRGIDTNNFSLENGINISFSNLIAMGDYYGKSKAPIAIDLVTKKAITDKNVLKSRFLDSYHALTKGKKNELLKIIKMIEEGKAKIEKGLAEGKTEEEAYKSISSLEDVELEIITHGRYSSLSVDNFDHFEGDKFQAAKQAFLAGYNLALEVVQNAQPGENQKLKEAYAIYGFACHYLTDTFSTGHMRVPRFELYEEIKGPFHEEISGLLALFQHNEDGCWGLNVTNRMGKWKAYGDSSLFACEEDELKMPVLAIQKGIDDIYDTYMKKPFEEDYSIENLFPEPTLDNFSPLFKIDESSKKVLRRADVADRNCKIYTNYWNPTSTLFELYMLHLKNPSESCAGQQQVIKVKDLLDRATSSADTDHD
jgi:hypothetical protein